MKKQLLIIIVFAFIGLSAKGQWVQTNGPFEGMVYCMATDGTNTFAGTFAGGVYLSTNNGGSWKNKKIPQKKTDVLGKEIKTINFSGKQMVIEKGEMSNGIYFVEIIPLASSGNGKVENRKILIQ